jgi:hypothetical protein
MFSVEDRVAAAMTAPLDAVVVAERKVRPPEDVVCRWDLPEPDRRALLRWGLPYDDHMRPLFQTGPDPALVPNLAGERERQAASPGERLYTLVHWGREELQLRIGAVAGTGRVLKIQPKPTTVDDLPPVLRESNAGLYHPSVEFFSSSVTQFVETSWRWQVAGKIAAELWRTPHQPKDDAPWEEHEAWFSRLRDSERIILEHIERIDGHVRADDTGTLWTTVVTELTHAGN